MNTKTLLNTVYGVNGQCNFLDYLHALIDARIIRDSNEVINTLKGNDNCKIILPIAPNYGYTIRKEKNENMVTIWKNIPNFKIKAKSDVRMFMC